MIAMSATRLGSFRTTPDEIIQYEDEHVKLSDTELLLKMYYNNENGQNSVSILLSHIVHVAWAGSDKKPSLLTKLKQKMKKSIQKQKPIENEIGSANDNNNNNEDITDVEEDGTKKEHKKHGTQFVVVASIKGSQQITGYGFSVIEDPLLFHKLIQPSHYVAIEEKKAKAKADAKAQAAAEENKKQTASATL